MIAGQSRVNFERTIFKRNKAIMKGFYMFQSQITFKDSFFQDVNASDIRLPAFAWITFGSTVSIINSTLSNIFCSDCPYGTVIAILSGSVVLRNSTFHSNLGSLGVILHGNLSNIDIDECNFYNNTAKSGEVIGRFRLGNIILKRSFFQDNKVGTTSLFSASSSNFNISLCLFSKNIARDLSHGFYFKDSKAFIEHSNFYDGTGVMTVRTSILYILDSDVIITNSTFLNGTGTYQNNFFFFFDS
jgi:hypothetical protein